MSFMFKYIHIEFNVMNRFFVFLFLLFFPLCVLAQAEWEPPNTVYICIDGLSRTTLYSLLKKDKLPNIKRVIASGNYRNVDVDGYKSETLPTYKVLLSGYRQGSVGLPIEKGLSIFEKLESEVPSISVMALFSHPQNLDAQVTINTLLTKENIEKYVLHKEVNRSAHIVARKAVNYIFSKRSPFFIFLNFTEVDYVGHRFRNGSERYSKAVLECDRAIGKIFDSLVENGLDDKTNIFLTTNYGFKYNARSHENIRHSFLASNLKIRYKGNQEDIVPTIYHTYKIPYKNILPKLPGKALVY
jgi:predicted AlkP superfamily pyrophosphatase or phosphodiesterase